MPQRSRAQRLNGLFPLSYTGVVPVSPVNFVIDNKPPTINDYKNFYIGDLWLDNSTQPPTTRNLWILTSVAGTVATWDNFGSGDLETLTGNSGGPVFPSANNINVVGDGVGITIVGNPGTHTLTASLVGGGIAAQSFPTDSGMATPNGSGALNIIASNSTVHSGSSVKFTGSGNTVLLNVTDSGTNTLVGNLTGNLSLSGTFNTGLGGGALSGLTTGSGNVALGAVAGTAITTGIQNTIVGTTTAGNLTTGSNNTVVGYGGAVFLSTGSNNIVLGNLSAAVLTTGSSNILINNPGIAAETNTMRFGTQGGGAGQQNRAFMAGVYGVTPAIAAPLNVVIDSAGQLGTGGGAGAASSFPTDSGTATPSASVLNIFGSNGITTTGSGNTVTIRPPAASQSFTATWNTETNITGDSTVALLGATAAATVLTNVGGGFFAGNGVGAGASYTVPATGLYCFYLYTDFSVGASGTAGIDFSVGLTGSTGFNYSKGPTKNSCTGYANNSGEINVGGSSVIQLTAGDVINFSVQSNGTAKNVTINTGTVGGYRVA